MTYDANDCYWSLLKSHGLLVAALMKIRAGEAQPRRVAREALQADMLDAARVMQQTVGHKSGHSEGKELASR